MKKILVPVDFSATALNAAKYAAQFSKTIASEILLYHVFHLPVANERDRLMAVTLEDVEKESINQLMKIKKTILNQFGGDIKITCEVNTGLLIDQIKEVCEQKKINWIIMGISEASKMKELLLSSNTLNIIPYINCPVIIVPPKAVYKPISRIVFACDYNSPQPNNLINQIIKLTMLFQARLDIVYINKIKHQSNPEEKTPGRLKFDNKIKKIYHSYHSIDNENVVEGINDFVHLHRSSLVIMLPKKHNILERFLQKSETKKMAFHTNVPLLAIH
ncbi:MAG TPA: universal stress protein [Bacteroidia bacterium]|jgi:nucleotide-binding universal stress UspA family protein|nr:universal stress protein [Bacteroidia bacterium]